MPTPPRFLGRHDARATSRRRLRTPLSVAGVAVTLAAAAVLLTTLGSATTAATFTDTAVSTDNTTTAGTIPTLAAPTGTATSSAATVTWTPSTSSLVGCQILQRSPATTGPWTTITTFTDPTTATYADTSVTAGSTYYYRVLAAAKAACYWPTPGALSAAIVIPARAYAASGTCDGGWASAGGSIAQPTSCVAWGIKADGSLVKTTLTNLTMSTTPTVTWNSSFTTFADAAAAG